MNRDVATFWFLTTMIALTLSAVHHFGWEGIGSAGKKGAASRAAKTKAAWVVVGEAVPS